MAATRCMHVGVVWLVLVAMVGCAGPAGTRGRESAATDGAGPASSLAPKRITAAITGNPAAISMKVNVAGGTGKVPGADEVEDLLNARLGMMDQGGVVRPRLAEAIPTVDNGLWKVLPDGRMEMTWKINPRASWHDGVPFTAEDLVFTYAVSQDRDFTLFRDTKFASIETVDAPDPRTLVVQWRKPYVFADNIFDVSILPRHLLERLFQENKAVFTELPYWREEFVGTGPYRLRQWAPGSHVSLEANDDYVLGRPKIDEIVIKFIPDSNTLLANVLAGEIDVTLGLGISLDQALEVRETSRNVRAEIALAGWVVMLPQLLWPNPSVVADVRFRRALLQALDREAMVETIQAGLGGVAHSFVAPNQPEYRDVEPSIVRYQYDPQRAVQAIETLGYARGGDGFFRDGTGQRLMVDLRTPDGFDVNRKILFPIADYWQRVGVAVEPTIISRVRANDREYRATFPGFEVTRNPNNMERLQIFHSSQVRLPESNYVGSNYMNYRNPEWDDLLDRYFSTIPTSARNQVLARIIHHTTDQLIVMGTVYDVEPILMNTRIETVTPRNQNVTSPQAWNAHEWNVR